MFVPGIWDTKVGVLPPPGIYFKQFNSLFSGSAKFIVENTFVEKHVSTDIFFTISTLSLVTKTKIWSSYYSCCIFIPLLSTNVSGQIVQPLQNAGEFKSHRTGLGPLVVSPIELGWHNGRSHQKVMMFVYMPLGNYDAERLVNTGINRWAFELDYGYTFLDPKTRREFSIAPGYTVITKNQEVDYLSGQEFHVDFTAIQRFPTSLGVGVVGYAFFQTTPDRGTGAELGANKGQVLGLGPIVVYDAKVGDKTISLTGKYYSEFAAKHRYGGDVYWLNLSMAF